MPLDPARNVNAAPFLRWAGSKRRLLDQLISSSPAVYDRYVEPFVGSACLFFRLSPKAAILSDINSELIETYLAIKNETESVIGRLKQYRCNKDEYYRVRSQDVSVMARAHKAARFIYLNRFCFNGLYRTNKSGRFNVPYGGFKSGELPPAKLLKACATLLGGTSPMAGSFENTLEIVRPGDFVYMDPPYAIKSRRVFNEYSHFSFGSKELKSLRMHMVRLDGLGVPFLISYGVSREGYEISKGFRRREVVVQRQIAGFAEKRRKSRELLITNY